MKDCPTKMPPDLGKNTVIYRLYGHFLVHHFHFIIYGILYFSLILLTVS